MSSLMKYLFLKSPDAIYVSCMPIRSIIVIANHQERDAVSQSPSIHPYRSESQHGTSFAQIIIVALQTNQENAYRN